MTPAHALRALAVGIVLLAILDPSITSLRRSDAVVAVVPSDARTDPALVERVAARLEDRFSVVRAPFPGAAATVVAGDRLPASAEWLPAPVFAVVPIAEIPEVRALRVEAPERAPLRGRTPVSAGVRIVGGAGRTVEMRLHSGGLVLDRREIPVRSDDERIRVELFAIPPRDGPLPLRVEASIGDRDAVLVRDLVVDVVDRRWSVLFFDTRPSWMSSFVRRSLEQDPRFEITSRIVTSPGLGTDFGSPPPGLGDPGALAGFDVVVAGAPEELTVGDVAGLERFLRREGGSVLLLLDRHAPGAHERLAGVADWSHREGGDVIALGGLGDPAAITPDALPSPADAPRLPDLQVTEVVRPVSLPPGAEVHLGAPGAAGVIWSAPVGTGRITVSGALDAWRFRDPGSSRFEEYWRELVAEAAARSGPPLEVRFVGSHGVVPPGSRVELEVTLPDPAPEAVSASAPEGSVMGTELSAFAGATLSARGEGGPAATSTPIRLWPDARYGRFRGSLRAPDRPGTYRVVAHAGDAEVGLPLVIDPAATGPGPDDPGMLAAWIRTRGGAVGNPGELEALGAQLRAALGPDRTRERWHPMRSAWWVIPFALALGGEWWWRRRRGLA